MKANMMSRQSVAGGNPGVVYTFHHTAMCPCMEPHDLFKDQVFDRERWHKHKSWRRYIPNSSTCLHVFAWYWPPLLAFVTIGSLVGLYATFLQTRGWPNVTNHNYMPIFQLASFALALLLVFRTNSSYDRWWEARKLWGELLSVSRDIVRMSMTFGGNQDPELVDMIARWVIAMPYVLKGHVTDVMDLSTQLEGVLMPHELHYLHDWTHRPSAVVQALSDAVFALQSSDITLVQINRRITTFSDTVAACERLYKQPIPTAYTRHTSRFLITFLIFLPFALWEPCKWLTPGVIAVVGFLLMGVESIGVQIEQPFSVLPLELLCSIIKTNILESLVMRSESKGLVAASRKVGTTQPQPMMMTRIIDGKAQEVSNKRRTSIGYSITREEMEDMEVDLRNLEADYKGRRSSEEYRVRDYNIANAV